MNERIKALMLEAGYAAPELAGRANTLAYLIVRECANILRKEAIVLEHNSPNKFFSEIALGLADTLERDFEEK